VKILFNKDEVSLTQLLKVFFSMHDPTTLNRQGADVGTQYRSVIFYNNTEQKAIVEEVIQALKSENVFTEAIVTEVSPMQEFYSAEEYHQNYFSLNRNQPYCRFVIQPKMEKFDAVFRNLKK